jgi:cytochrome c-type biogenesis protein CcmH/NrfG
MEAAHLKEALKLCPSDTRARTKLAAIQEDRGEIAAALQSWKMVLVYDPNNLEAWEGLARCRRRAAEERQPAGRGDQRKEEL